MIMSSRTSAQKLALCAPTLHRKSTSQARNDVFADPPYPTPDDRLYHQCKVFLSLLRVRLTTNLRLQDLLRGVEAVIV